MSSSLLSANSRASSAPANDIFLYDMPLAIRQSLCTILDELELWPNLAEEHMGYTRKDLQDIKRSIFEFGNSPSDVLLTMWGEQNHTITELFILLYRMQQYTAMEIIKDLVDKKYHRLIMKGQPDLSKLMSNLDVEKKKNGFDSKLGNETPDPTSSSNNESYDTTTSYSSEPKSESINIRHASEYASTIPQIEYKELSDATNNWSDKNVLGKGGFGTVYKGVWKYTAVAIKRIEYHGSESKEANKIQIQQSLNELKFLNSCRHDNILPLYGYSINGDEPCLVYQLMAGGSLEQRLALRKEAPLSWDQRFNIARGTARGLQYLHTFKEKPLIHGDIKPANILLDPCTQPKIGDFGLAREGPNALNSTMEVSKVYGTKPYLPVEFLGYKTLSTKVDTYSFGVVLLELVTGLRAYDKVRTHKFLTRHILSKLADNVPVEELMDPSLPVDPYAVEICRNLITLGKVCISERPEQRPEMVMVLWCLDNPQVHPSLR